MTTHDQHNDNYNLMQRNWCIVACIENCSHSYVFICYSLKLSSESYEVMVSGDFL